MSEEINLYNTDPQITDDSQFAGDPNASIIKVIGVGGGGCNAVKYMYGQDIRNVNFVVCNTDKQHLDTLPVPTKLLLGWNVTRGRGAGNNPMVGRECAEETTAQIEKLFEDGTEMVFITAGMGGGTGTGAAPVIANIAKEKGMLTIGIVTIPFLFEGESKIEKALDGASEMSKHVDALLMINNENLIELYSDLNLFNAFEKADDTLANAARSISDIISEKCYINVDFQDVKTTLKDSGTAIIATATGEGDHRISNAIDNALHSPLLKAHDINTSKRLLFKFSCSREEGKAIRMDEMAELYEFTSKLPSTVDVKWGIGEDSSLGDKVRITVLASGFDITVFQTKKPDRQEGDAEGATPEHAGPSGPIVFEGPKETEEEQIRKDERTKRIAEVYGKEKMVKQRRQAAKLKYAVLKPEQFDNHEVIAMIESVPTFGRESRFNEELRKLTENGSVAEKPSRPQTDDRVNSDTISFFDDAE